MKKELLEILACVEDKSPLDLQVKKSEGDSIIEGILTCQKCKMSYPIVNGTPMMLTADLRVDTLSPNDHLNSRTGDSLGVYGLPELTSFYKPGMKVLDLGAGNNKINFDGFVKLDLFPYDGIEVVGSTHQLPFKDESFDLVFSIAVFEHVKDPFRVAEEMFRITKKGGRVFVLTSFIQWEHAYPHHYFNFTQHGLRYVMKQFKEIECKPSPYCPVSELGIIVAQINAVIQDPHVESFVNQMNEKQDLLKNSENYQKIYPAVHFYGEKA